MRAFLLLLATLPACTRCPPGTVESAADGLCYAPEGAGGGGTGGGGQPGDDTGGAAVSWTLGDPIDKRIQTGEFTQGVIEYEWVDAVMIDDRYAAASGVSGVGIIDVRTGDVVHEFGGTKTWHVDSDGTWVVASARDQQVRVHDVTDPAAPGERRQFSTPADAPFHEDVGVDDGRILLGMHDWGARLFDPDGTALGTLPGTDVYAVDLEGDRAVVSDGAELVLWDIADLAAPLELDRIDLPGEARDLELESGRAAVALGGRGVGVWDVLDDAFVPRGTAPMPGLATNVALDGDYLWVGAWEQTALVAITPDGLLSLGHEEPKFSAMGIAARDGVAVVADWFGVQILDQVPGVAGPEISVPERLYFTEAGDERGLVFRNDGAMDLEVTLSPAADWALTETELTIAPGDSQAVSLTAPGTIQGSLLWSSNDPDESEGEVQLRAQSRTIGSAHNDFTMTGFLPPDDTPRSFTLSEQRGKVVLLVYFAIF